MPTKITSLFGGQIAVEFNDSLFYRIFQIDPNNNLYKTVTGFYTLAKDTVHLSIDNKIIHGRINEDETLSIMIDESEKLGIILKKVPNFRFNANNRQTTENTLSEVNNKNTEETIEKADTIKKIDPNLINQLVNLESEDEFKNKLLKTFPQYSEEQPNPNDKDFITHKYMTYFPNEYVEYVASTGALIYASINSTKINFFNKISIGDDFASLKNLFSDIKHCPKYLVITDEISEVTGEAGQNLEITFENGKVKTITYYVYID